MTFHPERIGEYIAQHKERFISEFAEFIAVPSVAADGRGVTQMADLLAQRFRKLDAHMPVNVQLHQTPGSPVVYAEMGSGDQTMLIYNHYDVQPEVPVELWDSPAFELRRENGRLYGRGTSDDKGELLLRIQAVEAWLATHGELPCRLKWVVEGEEEISSINLPQWCENNRDLLRADGLLWEGGGYDEKGRHVIARGCKGIAYFELRVHGAKLDLHSSVAPIVGNPAWRLVHALSTLKNERDEITIDGYMDHVAAPTPELIAQIDALPSDDYAQQKARFGISQWLNGMDDLTAKRRLYLEPTVTICGIESGYTLKGSKTVLPAYAFAKVDCRLVPNLTPHIAQEAIRAHLDRRGFTDVEVVLLGGEEPADSISGSRIERASIAALQDVFGETPINQPRFAGSGPMHPLSTMLDIPVVSAGTTWHPDARVHSPNENIVEKDYLDGIRFTAALIHRFAAGE